MQACETTRCLFTDSRRLHACVLLGKSVKNQLKYSNNVNAMVSAGSKGSSINICQIIACVIQHPHTAHNIHCRLHCLCQPCLTSYAAVWCVHPRWANKT